MIVTRTPLRISLVGGGTDLPSFYRNQARGGAVVSFTIDKYIYIAVNMPFENKVRVSYSQTENVKLARDVRHEIVNACLDKMGITHRIEIVSISDIPGKGTGLGSSSAYTVGLLNALTQHCILHQINSARHYENTDVAEEACDVEIRLLGKPIGKQDQYAVAYCGLNQLIFSQKGDVNVRRIPLSNDKMKELSDHLLLFYTGKTRKSSEVLAKQNQNIKDDDNVVFLMEKMRDMAYEMYSELLSGNISAVGELLDKNWSFKRRLADNISDTQIDELYMKAKDLGAVGGKVCGAGGGGFMLFYAPPIKHRQIADNLGLRQVPFNITRQGTKLVFMEGFND